MEIMVGFEKSNVQKEREDFWDRYYSGEITGDSKLAEHPSPYAVEIVPELSSGSSLLEIGCGNGRDSCLFASKGLAVVATDICEAAVRLTAHRLHQNCKALVASAVNLPDDLHVDYAYARFVLHALTEEEQNVLLKWLKTHVRKRIFIETRSVNDPRFGKGTKVGNNSYVDTHYRRFMSIQDIGNAAREAGLLVEEVEETTSGTGSDGARVLRATLLSNYSTAMTLR